MNWYLKYRPKNINELGLVSVRQSLKKLLAGPEFPHAFLLAGPRGLGKTSTARIIAQYVNCQSPLEIGVPCGKCPACQLFQQKTVMDVIEMDAASNRSVDDIRQLRSEVGLAPSQLKYKVYIIDEVHMLTNEAFNALLKTLEEPPKHVIFILATTEIQKIPETIKSRCQIIEYHLATTQEIVDTLKRVAKAEKLVIDDKNLQLIATKARGSFRDAIKLLERLAEGGKINPTLLNQLTQIDDLINQLFLSLKNQQIDQSIQLLDQIQEIAYPPRDLIYELELRFNKLLSDYPTLTTDQLSFYQKVVKILLQASLNFTEPISNYLSLKVSLLSLVKNKNTSTLSTSKTKNKIPTISSSPKVKLSPTEPPSQSFTSQTTPKSKVKLEEVQKIWPTLTQKSVSLNHGLKNILQSARLEKIENGNLYLEVGYALQKDLLEKAKVRRWLETNLSQLLHQQIGIIINLNPKLRQTKSKKQTPNVANDERLSILMS